MPVCRGWCRGRDAPGIGRGCAVRPTPCRHEASRHGILDAQVARMIRQRIALILTALFMSVALAEAASPPDDRILALDRYTSDKGRTLGATYGATLKQI